MSLTRRRFSQIALTSATGIVAGTAIGPRLSWADGGEVLRAHGGSLIGALKYGPDFKNFDYVNPDAPKGGTVRLDAVGGFDSFNPFIVKGDSPAGAGLVFDTLMTPPLDQGSTEYGLLAEWFEYPKDYAYAAFKLREEARWHDGRPVSAADVVWTFKALVAKGQPLYRLYYANVADVRDMGAGVVRFDFDQTGNRELPHIMGQIAVLPKHWWEAEGREFDRSSLEPLLGSGPYRIGNFEANRFVEYDRVEEYWGADLPVRRGTGNFDAIRYEFFRDSAAAFEAFKAGDIDFRRENSAKQWALGYDFAALKEGRVLKQEVPFDGPKQVQGFAMNLRRPKFQSIAVRKALALLFDFEWTNRVIYYGQYSRPSSFFQGTRDLTPAGAPQGAELEMLEALRGKIPDETFGPAYAPPVSTGSGRIRTRMRAAKRLLLSAGWRYEGGKLVDAAGAPFVIEFLSAQNSQSRVIEPYMKNLERVGITASFRIVDAAQYVRRVGQDPNFDFDMITNGWANSESPGNEQREYWGSASAARVGTRNIGGVADPAVDALIDKIIFSADREELAAASRALDRVLTWNHYAIFQLYMPVDRIAFWDRFGHPDPYPPRDPGFPSVWWHDADKAAALKENG